MAESEIFNAEFYQKLNTMRLSMKMKLAAGQSGGRKSNAKGNSVEFSDFREYILGDDIRRIDWNAYGRFDKLFVKLFMEEKEGDFRIWLDASKSMEFGDQSKHVCALRIAAALSYVVLENLDRLHLNVVHGATVEPMKSQTGRQAFAKVIAGLEQVKFDSDTCMAKAVATMPPKTKGVSIVISDFLSDDTEELLRYLTFHGQEVILVQVLAREEIDPELDGTVKLTDSETFRDVRVTMSGALMKEYHSTYDAFIHKMDSLCRKYAATYIRVASDESLDAIMFGALSKLGNNL